MLLLDGIRHPHPRGDKAPQRSARAVTHPPSIGKSPQSSTEITHPICLGGLVFDRHYGLIFERRRHRTPRFVKTQTDGLVLDEAALARARRLAGLKGLVTNIPATVLPAAEVISSYADLWHVEHSFRMSKSDLRARPLFARRRDSIEAHLTIVFTALAIGRTVQDRTGLSLRRVLRQLRPLRSATIQANGAIQTMPPALRDDELAVLDDLKQASSRH